MNYPTCTYTCTYTYTYNHSLWIECFGLLIGVYITLPVMGAIVLVRLLDNTATHFHMTDQVLLTSRRGLPVISVRSISSTGQIYTNRHVNMQFIIKTEDNETGELYSYGIEIQLKSAKIVQSFAVGSSYTINDLKNDPLIKHEVIIIDSNGKASWNYGKLSVVWYTMTADNLSRTMTDTKFFMDLKHHLIQYDDLIMPFNDPL